MWLSSWRSSFRFSKTRCLNTEDELVSPTSAQQPPQMPASIAMATAKLSPMLPASSKPLSSSSINSPTTSVSTISIPVSAFHDPTSNVITITPYIFVKTATVAEQMQALRQDKKIAKPPEQPTGALRVKRRTDLSKLGLPDAKPASVSRRNARERNRVKQVNLGFETLREHVPNGKKNKKMSKVQTLRSAAQYIKDLYMILHGELPALGSPNVVDEHEPNSPLDNSVCSASDNDNDVSVSSPEPQLQQLQSQQLQQSQQASSDSDTVSQSSISSVFNKNANLSHSPQQQQHLQNTLPVHQRPKQQPLILKKEHVSVLQQQLSRGQLSRVDYIAGHIKPQLIQQQEKQKEQEQQLQQQQSQPEVEQQKQPQQQIFSPSTLRLDPLTCTTVLGLSNVSAALNAATSSLTFTQLSPVSLVDDQCDNYMDLSPEQNMAHLHTDPSSIIISNNSPDNVSMDIPSSPSVLQPYLNDVNMNIIGSHQTDFDALQSYYKAVRNEHFKNVDSTFVFENCQDNSSSNNSSNSNSFQIGQNIIHSPASSLSSSTSSLSSEADVCVGGQYDYDSVDREALLDISNWISEICSQGMHLNDTSHSQQASLAYSH